jgi:hypothetical protein
MVRRVALWLLRLDAGVFVLAAVFAMVGAWGWFWVCFVVSRAFAPVEVWFCWWQHQRRR